MHDVILNDKVGKMKGFIRTTHHDGGRSYLMRLHPKGDEGDRWVLTEGDRWILPLDDTETAVPPYLAEFVEEVSLMKDISAHPHREYGVYRYESARAQVTVSPGKPGCKAHITGKTIADVRELYHRILAGTIRPDESYEVPQTGMPRKEMEAAIAKFKELAERFKRKDRRGWPFATKGGVADMIQKILHGGDV